MEPKEIINNYTEILEDREELSDEYILLVKNNIDNDRRKELEDRFEITEGHMNALAKRFIELFI